MGLWLLFNLWRYFYFGEWVPNTAVAQRISLGNRLDQLLAFHWPYIERSLATAKVLLSAQGALYLLLLAPLALVTRYKRLHVLLILLAACSVAMVALHAFAFSGSRLDPPRTTTGTTVIVWLAVIYSATRIRLADITVKRGMLCALLLAPLAAFAAAKSYIPPYYLNWRIGLVEEHRREFAAVAEAHGIDMPTISNVDLGAMSWYKQFNIVDLGAIGSKVVAAVPFGPLLSEYFFELAAPDMITTSEALWWSCLYRETVFDDERFASCYAPIKETLEDVPDDHVWCAGRSLRRGMYIRKDVTADSASFERRFMDRLLRQPSLEVIANEIADCAARAAPSPYACAYIARAVYREKPRLLERYPLEAIAALFKGSSTAAFDAFLINGHVDTGAYKEAIIALFDSLAESKGMARVGASGGYDIYANGKFIAYRKAGCTRADAEHPFFLNTFMDANSAEPVHHGFGISTHGFRHGELCVAAKHIPAPEDGGKITQIITGQWNPKKRNYAWRITLPPPP